MVTPLHLHRDYETSQGNFSSGEHDCNQSCRFGRKVGIEVESCLLHKQHTADRLVIVDAYG
ncbi:MAG: hypothetical protein KF726_02080 [Anaerolineae bacterium]|nr:hypothetical protein [Anaerolineae bacterium]